jgi:hypothetical protein
VFELPGEVGLLVGIGGIGAAKEATWVAAPDTKRSRNAKRRGWRRDQPHKLVER